jgi:phosphoribosylglycinamide formyltransferase-1
VPQIRLVVLASGSGTLFQSLIDEQKTHQAQIVGLVTDVPCQAIDRAKAAGIKVITVEMEKDRNLWDKKLSDGIESLNPDLVVSAGFMKILGSAVLEKFEGKIINTHPALLPNFPGAHAVKDVLAAGAKETGSTIHFVDAGVDTGEVITQEVIAILPTDTEDSLHERIKQVERKLLVQVVGDFVSGKISSRARS